MRRPAPILGWALAALLLLALPAEARTRIRDAEIEHEMAKMSQPIFEAAGLTPSAVHILILQDDTINAFVAGGANIFLHTGLLLAAETPDMLMGVIAHEAGHIAGGHLARGTEKIKNAQLGVILSYVLGAAAAAAGSPEAAGGVITAGQHTLMRNMLSFSRANENAADQAAISYLDSAGVSAAGMLKFFGILRRQEALHFGQGDPYALTHPLSAERIEHLRGHVAHSSLPPGKVPPQMAASYARIYAKLFAFLKPTEETLRRYPAGDTSVAGRLARAVAWYKKPDLAQSLKELDPLIAQLPRDPFLHELRGQILFENGRLEQARGAYQKAVALLPDAPLIRTDLAKTLLAMNRAELVLPAIRHLEVATTQDNTNPESWRLLATAYGKTGNLGMSSLALAEEAVASGDTAQALAQSKKAIELLPAGKPGRLRATDIQSLAKKMREDEEDEN